MDLSHKVKASLKVEYVLKDHTNSHTRRTLDVFAPGTPTHTILVNDELLLWNLRPIRDISTIQLIGGVKDVEYENT